MLHRSRRWEAKDEAASVQNLASCFCSISPNACPLPNPTALTTVYTRCQRPVRPFGGKMSSFQCMNISLKPQPPAGYIFGYAHTPSCTMHQKLNIYRAAGKTGTTALTRRLSDAAIAESFSVAYALQPRLVIVWSGSQVSRGYRT